MDEVKKRIVEILIEWHKQGLKSGWDGMWYGYEALQDEINIKFKEYYQLSFLKVAMKSLKNENKVKLMTTYNMDGELSGSGWFIHNIECA